MNLPDSSVAVLFNSMLEPGYADSTSDIEGWLKDRHYEVHRYEQTIPNLLLGDISINEQIGLLVINSHGLTWRSPRTNRDIFLLWTTEEVTSIADQHNYPDLTPGDHDSDTQVAIPPIAWCYFAMDVEAPDGGVNNVPVKHYVITSAFIRKYWIRQGAGRLPLFSKDSLALVNACHGFPFTDPDWPQGRFVYNVGNDFLAAVRSAGAGMYVSWAGFVQMGDAKHATNYLIDRLLGANRYQPEKPPQRPFPFDDVWKDMDSKKNAKATGAMKSSITPYLLKDGTIHVFIGYMYSDRSGQFGLLAPSIAGLLTGEIKISASEPAPQLFLGGGFGPDPGEDRRDVSINDHSLKVLEWKPDGTAIRCLLPPAPAADGCGLVVVGVDGRRSNAVPLTLWKISLEASETQYDLLEYKYYAELYFRADVHKSRKSIGSDPAPFISASMAISAASGSTIAFSANGTARVSTTAGVGTEITTITWSGYAEVQFFSISETGQNKGFLVAAYIGADEKKIRVHYSPSVFDSTTMSEHYEYYSVLSGPVGEETVTGALNGPLGRIGRILKDAQIIDFQDTLAIGLNDDFSTKDFHIEIPGDPDIDSAPPFHDTIKVLIRPAQCQSPPDPEKGEDQLYSPG